MDRIIARDRTRPDQGHAASTACSGLVRFPRAHFSDSGSKRDSSSFGILCGGASFSHGGGTEPLGAVIASSILGKIRWDFSGADPFIGIRGVFDCLSNTSALQRARKDAMTTRQRLSRRFYRGLLALISVALAVGLLDAIVGADQTPRAVIRTVGIVSFIAMLRYWYQTPRVHCHMPLAWMALSWRPAGPAASVSIAMRRHKARNSDPPCLPSPQIAFFRMALP